ncbi:molybdopterin molybdotransferase MoeA [Thiomicrospira microaerophila]|uniref:molybdopterin molybdotransferase MoeA n=1 Tax=Thiomicrospira microaerophila TaxID=406020 RepID=UPI00200BB199|nr:gephyrin-like molybdotransferase Glp [Thiomicrospira microaerophila]UQB43201.1 molybdopterin molybdotransferase MoeA [Thiomicrospira microaerophila]
MKHQAIEFAQAREKLLNHAKLIPNSRRVKLDRALGGVLAQDVISQYAIPPQNNSAMDGYALSVADLTGSPPYRVAVSQRIAAGQVGTALVPKTAAQIFTGAPMPEGADTVVIQEEVRRVGDWIEFNAAPSQGQHIRLRGSDIAPKSLLLTVGRKLRPQDIALLASAGVAEVDIYQTLNVALLNTGNELVEPGSPLPVGGIYNSNKYLIKSQVQALGFNCLLFEPVEDSLQATLNALQQAAEQADVIITTGGVSVGGEDHLRAAIEQLGELQAWQVKMKPGKPFAIGKVTTKQTPVLALPGNPVAALINFALFARPFLLLCQGVEDECYLPLWTQADFDWFKPSTRMEVLRARLEPGYQSNRAVQLYAQQSASSLLAFNWANGLVILPPEKTVKKGDWVEFVPLASLNMF